MGAKKSGRRRGADGQGGTAGGTGESPGREGRGKRHTPEERRAAVEAFHNVVAASEFLLKNKRGSLTSAQIDQQESRIKYSESQLSLIEAEMGRLSEEAARASVELRDLRLDEQQTLLSVRGATDAIDVIGGGMTRGAGATEADRQRGLFSAEVRLAPGRTAGVILNAETGLGEVIVELSGERTHVSLGRGGTTISGLAALQYWAVSDGLDPIPPAARVSVVVYSKGETGSVQGWEMFYGIPDLDWRSPLGQKAFGKVTGTDAVGNLPVAQSSPSVIERLEKGR